MPQETTELMIKIRLHGTDGEPYISELAGRTDEIRIGITEECLSAIREGIDRAVSDFPLP